MNALFTAIEQRPRAAFAVFALVHAVVWSVLPAALYPNLPLDLIEALTYGREWQLGYDKLPPLPWWLVEVTYRIFGHDIFYYALAQVAVVASFALIWRMALPLVGVFGALAALLVIDGLHFFHYSAAKFNHDVMQLPFWALAGVSFHAALRQGRLPDWLLLGVAVGLAFWAKYFVAILAIPLALFMLLDGRARRHLATPGPYLAVAVALLIAAPHIVWLVLNQFVPFQYAEARAVPARGLFDHLLHPLRFLAEQLFYLLPALAIALPLWRRKGKDDPQIDDYDRRVVALLAFGPAATITALSLLTGRGVIAMWGYPMWLFLGLWMVLVLPIVARQRFVWLAAAWAVVFVGFCIGFVANYTVLPHYDGRYRAVFFPGEQLAAEMSTRFRVMTGRPLAYVVATMWTGGNIAHYAPERPRVLIDGSPRRAPWIDLGDLRARGAIVVWTAGNPRQLPVEFRTVALDAEIQEPFALPYLRGPGEVMVGWALLRPRPQVAHRH